MNGESLGASDLESVVGVVFVALREELQPLAPQLKRRTTHRAGSVRFVVGNLNDVRVALCRTGVGADNAARRAQELLDCVRPRWALVTGFAGGVSPKWRSGDCIVASEVVWLKATDNDQETVGAAKSWRAPEAAGQFVRKDLIPPLRCGRLATVTEVVRTPADKRRVSEEFGVDAVEMESAGILEHTTRQSITTVCTRIILDEHDLGLPLDFGPLMSSDGNPRLLKTLVAIGSRPDKWREIARLRARAAKASETLARLFPHFVETMSEYS